LERKGEKAKIVIFSCRTFASQSSRIASCLTNLSRSSGLPSVPITIMAINTTAINKYNVAVTDQSGKVGNVRYVQKNGETYVRSAHNSAKTNNRSDDQMTQRMLFASLSALYSKFALTDLLRGAFQFKEKNQSDFNAFMKVNQGLGVYFTKQQKAQGAVAALPVTISQGRATGIEVTSVASNKAITDINFPRLSSSMTVAEVSQHIINNNTGFKNGDNIVFIAALQNVSAKDVVIDVVKFPLDITSAKVWINEYSTIYNEGGKMAFAMSVVGCCGVIHTQGSKISTCKLYNNNGAFISQYISDTQWQTARDSYGTAKQSTLFSNSVSPAGVTPTPTPTPTPAKVTVTVNQSPNGAGEPTGAGQYDKGTTVTVNANPIEGWSFSMWSDGEESAERTFVANEDVTLTAVYTRSQG